MSEAERIAEIAKRLTRAQREAIVKGNWNATVYGFRKLGITQDVSGLRYICELSPLGQQVRAFLASKGQA